MAKPLGPGGASGALLFSSMASFVQKRCGESSMRPARGGRASIPRRQYLAPDHPVALKGADFVHH